MEINPYARSKGYTCSAFMLKAVQIPAGTAVRVSGGVAVAGRGVTPRQLAMAGGILYNYEASGPGGDRAENTASCREGGSGEESKLWTIKNRLASSR